MSLEITRLTETLREAVAVNRQLARVQRASLQQFFTIKDLCERYRLGEKAIRAVLKQRGLLHGAVPGCPVRVRLNDVLALDQDMEAESR